MNTFSQYHSLFHQFTKPFAFVDMDAFNQNFENLKKRCNKKPIRIATKSIRSSGILEYLKHEKGISRWMCFTVTEAIFLSEKGFDNLLVAYPTLQESMITEMCSELKKGKTIYLTADSIEQLEKINTLAGKNNISIPISLDVDISDQFFGIYFGVYRSSIKTMQQLEACLDAFERLPFIKLKGIMTYDAQIAGIADQLKTKQAINPIIQTLKKKSLKSIRKKREQITTILNKRQKQLDFFNAGGTGSLELVSNDNTVTEVTFGSGLFQSTYFDHYSNFQNQPAAGYVLEVCRNPKPNYYTCLGGGYIASGSIGLEKLPTIIFPKGAKLIKDEGAGEVQTPFFFQKHFDLKQTNFAIFRHAKAGELCERFNHLHLLSNGEQIDFIPTYRGEGKCFL